MKVLPEIELDSSRTLTNEQIDEMTPEDFLVVFHRSQFIDEDGWVLILVQQLLRVLRKLQELFELDIILLETDEMVSDYRISFLMKNLIGIKDESE